MSKPLLQIIIASTRPGRVGLPVGTWFSEQATADGRFDVEVLDLAEINLPLMDEPNHPSLQRYTHQHTKDWAATIERGDAFVLVMPEYNHGYTAPLKNALDYLVKEWANKPVGLVSYGGISAGLRATQVLKPTLMALRMMTAVEAVMIPMAGTMLADGAFTPSDAVAASVTPLLDELTRLLPASTLLRS